MAKKSRGKKPVKHAKPLCTQKPATKPVAAAAERIDVRREELEKPSSLRTFKPRIDLKVCQKNYDCVIFCPRNAISINPQGWPVVNYDTCDGCLICLRVCPTAAIKEERG